MTQVWVSIGSNIEPETHVRHAIRLLRDRFGVLQVSPVYRTAAVGFDGEDFLNLVVGFDTDSTLAELDQLLDAIEQQFGRRRDGERFAPRSLDIDILFYGELVNHQQGGRIPRRELLECAFMLKPLYDVAPGFRHPQIGKTIAEIWAEIRNNAELSQQRCERTELDLS